MWTLKGFFIWLFSFGTIIYFLLNGFVPRPGVAFDVRTILFMTVSNLSWYLGLIASLCVGLIIARSWHIHAAIWVALIVTELIPAGMLCFFLMVVAKMKRSC